MVQGDCVIVRRCRLCCLCSWRGKQVVLYFKDNPWNWPPFATFKQVNREKFIPAVTGCLSCSEVECSLLALPARLGGLGLTIPIAFQGSDPRTATTEMKAIKFSVQSTKRDIHLAEAEALVNQLPPAQQRLLECTREKGASSWVTTLPIDEHGFLLHKGAFRDALCLRYGWKLQNLPLHCACGDSLG